MLLREQVSPPLMQLPILLHFLYTKPCWLMATIWTVQLAAFLMHLTFVYTDQATTACFTSTRGVYPSLALCKLPFFRIKEGPLVRQ